MIHAGLSGVVSEMGGGAREDVFWQQRSIVFRSDCSCCIMRDAVHQLSTVPGEN